MCGRTACTLAPDEICQGCSYSLPNSAGKQTYVIPQWIDHPGDHTYSPSANVAPSKFTPILFRNSSSNASRKRNIDGNDKTHNTKYVVQPMMWGIIPHFYKGESPKGHGYKTNNCRIEDIEEKKIFKPSLNKGQRCVVVCDGFYEWQSTQSSKSKQPFFIHATQKKDIEIWNKDSWPNELWNEDEGWKGANLFKMAGLYSVWTSSQGETFYSYTVITMEADEKFSWIHHRIPAVLETQEDIDMWLEEEDYKKAISNLKNNVTVSSYPVSSLVNNSRNQDGDFFHPVDATKKNVEDSKPAKSTFLLNWLKSSSSEKPNKSDDRETKKKVKPSQTDLMAWVKKEEKKDF